MGGPMNIVVPPTVPWYMLEKVVFAIVWKLPLDGARNCKS